MLVANTELKVGDETLEPGQPVPEALTRRQHVLHAHISRRNIIETDAASAKVIRERYLSDKRAREQAAFDREIAALKAHVEAARAEIEKSIEAAQEAEEAHKQVVAQAREAEAKARAKLEALDAQLAALAEPKKSKKES